MNSAQTEMTPTDESTKVVPERRWFGIDILDDLFRSKRIHDRLDLRERVVVSLGGSGTLKSRLAYGFLAEAFGASYTADDPLREDLVESGVILLSSEGLSEEQLMKAMAEWGVDTAQFADQILLRSVRPRFLSSSSFVFRLKTCIRHMKRVLEARDGLPRDRRHELDPTRIRVVIDNWNSIVDAHAPLKKDPQLLQSVALTIREEGVLAYLVGTQPGSPRENHSVQRPHNLAGLEATHIHTWPVDFFGDRRIAITTSMPGSFEHRTAIYHLSREPGTDFQVRIGRDFDIYEALESGEAKRVDLRVKLYSGFQEGEADSALTTAKYNHEVSALFGDLFPRSRQDGEVVSFENIERYDAFKEYIQNLDRAQLDESLVFQVDEFWRGEHDNQPFANLTSYLNSTSLESNSYVATTAADQNVTEEESGEGRQRAIKTETPNRGLFDTSIPKSDLRVPLHKDFGLLLADRSAWWTAKDLPIGEYRFLVTRDARVPTQVGFFLDRASVSVPEHKTSYRQLQQVRRTNVGELPTDGSEGETRKVLVADVWNALCIPGYELEIDDKYLTKQERNLSSRKTAFQDLFQPSWELFLQTARVVAMRCGKHSFDVDLRTSESLSSLVLEIWFSKIKDLWMWKEFPATIDPERSLDSSDEVLESKPVVEDKEQIVLGDFVLRQKLEILPTMVDTWMRELDYAVRLLAGFVPGRYREYDLKLSPAVDNAVAFRTWFAPAVLCQSVNRNLTPLRLPGRFSARGDWHLGVARGSRSLLLAENAIDKLVSVEMNRKRLRDGIGLPVRETPGEVESALTIPDPKSNLHRRLQYQDIQQIEPVAFAELKKEVSHFPGAMGSDKWQKPLCQIFRSCIPGYDRDSVEFFLMIASLLRTVTPLSDVAFREGQESHRQHEADSQARATYKQFINSTGPIFQPTTS